jgi:hypothetical protein
MANEFRLSVDQIVAAIGLLGDEEQAELRLELLAWLAGSAAIRPEPTTERLARRAWTAQPPSDEDDLYLYDELMALTDE